MAEEVQISNVGGDGVASEVTLQALVAAIEKMSGGKGKGSAAAKVQDLHNRAVAAGTTATTANTATTAKATSTTTNAAVATGKFAKTIATATSSVLGKFAGSVAGLTRELLGGAEDISSFARHLPFVGSYLSSLTGLIDENIDSFRKLSQVGATFGDGLNDIRATAARAGIPLGEFTQLVSQNAERMKFFGATTAAGATSFANMSKELRNGPGKRFIALGYTAQELNEALIDYAEFTQSQVGAERTQNKMTAEGAANYLETIDQLAAVTGKRRDQIKAEMNAGLADQRARLAMANMSTEEQKRFSANLAAAPKGLQDALTDAADGVLDNPLTQGLSVASETFRKDADKIKNMNAQEYNNFMAQVGKELDASGKALGAGAQAVMSSNTGYGQAIAMGAELRDKQHMSDKEYADLLKKRNEEAKKDEGLKGFSDAIRNLRSGLMDAFISSGVLKTLQDAFNDLAKVVSTPEFKEGLKVVVEGLISGLKLLIGGVATVVEFLGSIGKTFGTAGVIAAVVAGITALFAAKVVVGALASKVTGTVKEKALSATGLSSSKPDITTPSSKKSTTSSKPDAVTPSSKKSTTSNAGKGVGDAIGNIGSGIGKGLGGVLSGLASGISAFANPMVVAGAAALGAAIVLIGGAIAGATWLVGKSLPTMAEGLQSFEALDGQKLIDAGKGMGAIALGMAAFGAGSAVAGLGSLVGGISEGLVSLFGGDNPLTKLQEFQKYDLDAARIENNANALVSYSKGMAALGGSSALSGIGSAVSAIGSGIVALFGADDPLTGLIKFQAYSFDAAKIRSNADAVSAYADAMKDFPQSPSASVFTAATDAIISLLGGNTNLLAPIKDFGDVSLNTSGIKNNAEAVKAYSGIMKDFPQSPSASVFTLAKDAIFGLLGGNTSLLAPIKEFGDVSLNTSGIKNNAEAVKAYSSVMQDFPASPSASLFTLAKDAIIGLLGGNTSLLAPIKEFGDVSLNTSGIKNNAEAVKAYSSIMKDFPTSPSASVFTAATDAIISLLGGNKDPFAPMLKFGDMRFNTSGINENAKAVKAYSSVMQDFPTSPSASLFTAAKDAIIGLLGGNTNMMTPIKTFGDMAFNTSGIIENAKAVKAYAFAMKDFPATPSVSLFDSFKNGIISFLGGNTDPFAPMMKFGEMKFNTAGIIKNSETIKAYSTSMSGLASLSTTGDIKLPTLSGLSSLTAIGDIKIPTNLASNLDILNKGLDTTGVRTYTKAMEDLVSVLGDLNNELGKDKTTENSKTSASDVVAKTGPQVAGSGSNDQLNSIMNQVLLVLTDMRDLDDKVEKNTRNIIGSNLAQGGVSKIGR